MSVTDPIADMLTRIRNATVPRHETVIIPMSKTKLEISRILKDEGFIEGYEEIDGGTHRSSILIYLHYIDGDRSGISGLKRVSKPGLRVYVGKGEIPRYFGGLAVSIISTSEGLMTGQQAWKKGLGGELLCYVW